MVGGYIMSKQATLVSIEGSTLNAYSQIIRACISASNACSKLKDTEHLEAFVQLTNWASTHHQKLLKENSNG